MTRNLPTRYHVQLGVLPVLFHFSLLYLPSFGMYFRMFCFVARRILAMCSKDCHKSNYIPKAEQTILTVYRHE